MTKKEKENIILLEKLSIFLEEKRIASEIMDDMLVITQIKNECSANVLIEKFNIVNLSFEIRVEPTESAILTQLIMDFFNKENGFKVKIYEPYALVMDERNIMIDMLTGQAALDYFYLPTTPKMLKTKYSTV